MQGRDVHLDPSSTDTNASRKGAKPEQSLGKDLLLEETWLKAMPRGCQVKQEGFAGKAREGQMVPS